MPQPYWAHPVPSWGLCWAYLAAIGTSTGLHVAILHCIKFKLTWRFSGLKWSCPATCKCISGIFCLDGTNQQGIEIQEQCMCVCIWIILHIDLFFPYLFVYFILSIYVFLVYIDACIYIWTRAATLAMDSFFLGAKPAQNGGKQTFF